MKLIGAISTAVLSLSLGIGIPAYAQQDQHDQQEENKDKPAQENEKKAQPEKPAKQEAAKPEAAKPEEKNNKPEERTAQAQAKPEQNAQHAPAGRIPADRYKANFGREHSFRVTQADYSNHRFQYGGYSFGFVDAWPSNWLYTQDVYVVEINGVYYLCNASYPGVNLALSIQL
jgi:hypothetical protein